MNADFALVTTPTLSRLARLDYTCRNFLAKQWRAASLTLAFSMCLRVASAIRTASIIDRTKIACSN